MSNTPNTQTNNTTKLPPIGGPVSPQEEEFGFTDNDDGGPKTSKYAFAFDPNKTYNARVVSAAEIINTKGHQQLNLEVLCLQGPAEGLKFKKYLPYTYNDKATGAVKTNGFTKTTLTNVFGATQDQATKKLRFKKSNVLGALVGVKFSRSEYNGKMVTNVDDIVAPVETSSAGTGGANGSPIPF